jgi:hypothetical protein
MLEEHVILPGGNGEAMDLEKMKSLISDHNPSIDEIDKAIDVALLNAINSATQCSVMLPPSAKVMLPSSATECCHLRRSPKGVQSHPRRRRAGPRLLFGQDDVWFEFRGVRCG